MEETGEGFEGVELEEELDWQSMDATVTDSGGRHSDLWKEMFRKAGHQQGSLL